MLGVGRAVAGNGVGMSASSVQNITVSRADDWHVHVRQDDLLSRVGAWIAAGGVGRICAMPNTKPPIIRPDEALRYRDSVAEAVGPSVTVCVSLYLSDALTPSHIAEAARHDCLPAVKFYPRGVTTHSEAGSDSLRGFEPVLEAMEHHGLVLQVHGEALSNPEQGVDVLNAEARFLRELRRLHARYPGLRIVLEHVSSRAGVDCIRSLGDTVAATVTVHHLDLTIDDWAGNIHNYCKPVAKRYRDRAAIREAVKTGHPRFFLGSDSAPHERGMKETACGCAGVFTSPWLMPYLADCLDRLGALDRMESFASRFGAAFYGRPIVDGTVTLERQSWTVPDSCAGIVPYRSGDQLMWRMAGRMDNL